MTGTNYYDIVLRKHNFEWAKIGEKKGMKKSIELLNIFVINYIFIMVEKNLELKNTIREGWDQLFNSLHENEDDDTNHARCF